MKVAFCSNFLNSHQIPFCNKMYELLGNDFYFVETEELSEERKNLGFSNESDKYPYVIQTYKSEAEYNRARKFANEADVVMIGSAPDDFITERINMGKLTFRVCERYFKLGKWVMLHPKMIIRKWKKDIRFRKKNLYMLCASAYTASDCRFIGCYIGKTYKWGYFPIIKKNDADKLFEEKKAIKDAPLKLLWVARFIDWKHPEKPIKVIKKLTENGYNVELNMIGTGKLENKYKKAVKKSGMEERIHIRGAMPTEKVLDEMCKCDIFLMTSDRQEGWGAVLNESMSCGCAIVASKAIGAVPYLLENGENGLSYNDKSFNDLYNKVEMLVKDSDLREKLGRNAVKTVNGLWSAENAAERLIKLFQSIIEKNPVEFEEGPCSRAE